MTEEKKDEGAVQAASADQATNADQNTTTAAVPDDVTDGGLTTADADKDEDDRIPCNRKRLAILLAALIGGLALVICIGYLMYSGLKQVTGDANAAATATGSTRVTVPAVRGVDATGCRTDELVVEGNRLVFKNGCAKPVFHDK